MRTRIPSLSPAALISGRGALRKEPQLKKALQNVTMSCTPLGDPTFRICLHWAQESTSNTYFWVIWIPRLLRSIITLIQYLGTCQDACCSLLNTPYVSRQFSTRWTSSQYPEHQRLYCRQARLARWRQRCAPCDGICWEKPYSGLTVAIASTSAKIVSWKQQ